MGAVIGGGTAVYQCNVHGQGDCSGSYVATSAAVGAAAGAAGAAAGGAVSGLGIGEGESAIVSGLASGAANSSTGYVLNSALTGQNMSLGAVFREAINNYVALPKEVYFTKEESDKRASDNSLFEPPRLYTFFPLQFLRI